MMTRFLIGFVSFSLGFDSFPLQIFLVLTLFLHMSIECMKAIIFLSKKGPVAATVKKKEKIRQTSKKPSGSINF